MRITDIINESKDNIQDFGYGVEQTHIDSRYNPESVRFAQENAKHYEEIGFEDDITPVITYVEEDPETHRKFDSEPEDSAEQSAGYRGREKAKERAGIPHSPYHKQRQGYIDTAMSDISRNYMP